MRLLARTVLVLALTLVAFAGAYVWRDGNLGLVRNGCIGDVGLPPDTGMVQFKVLPPHFVCLYTKRSGRVVERSS